eukprot:gene15338-16915_t
MAEQVVRLFVLNFDDPPRFGFEAFNQTEATKKGPGKLIKLLALILLLFGLYWIVRYFIHNYKSSLLRIQVEGYTPIDVYCQTWPPSANSRPSSDLKVVLLHEGRMKNTWEAVNTPKILSDNGFHVFSLTLPTITKLVNSPVTYPFKGNVLFEALKRLKATDAIIVVPSFTGSYGMPLVLRSHLPLKGFVAVAPIDTEHFTAKEYKILTIPTLIIYGENENIGGGKSNFLDYLKLVQNKEVVVIKNAGSDCFVDQPDEFHQFLLKFLYNKDNRNVKVTF